MGFGVQMRHVKTGPKPRLVQPVRLLLAARRGLRCGGAFHSFNDVRLGGVLRLLDGRELAVPGIASDFHRDILSGFAIRKKGPEHLLLFNVYRV